ncbi:hypothetical protein NQ317_014956 [Molorchus minor]|uniref:ascorbate ferrireductase (transmembrane) n=1 Tax=Molorchus minor TaxID=1323400 RepID=A0ABQ9JJF1_9CUCU|nr:hypothetical protein NQ317_014956 [Molorchus minor]
MEEKPGDKGGKHQIHHKGGRGGPHPPSVVKDQLTNVAHFCILAYVLLICYLCLRQPLDMFTWHPLLLSIGWMFLMVEGTLLISKENMVTRKLKLSHTKKERYHWIFFTVGAVLIAAGFLVVYRRKDSLNKSHFQSWHAIFGLIGIAAYFFSMLEWNTAAL